MQRLELDDFSGGISEQYASSGFTSRQWSKLKGFIIDTDYTIRSQWPAQSVGASNAVDSGVLAVSGFTGSAKTWLVAIAVDGAVWYAEAPDEDDDYTDTNTQAWTELTAIAANTDYRFITDVLLPIDGVGEVNALLLHSVSGTTNAYGIYEDATGNIALKVWDRFYPVDQPNLIDPLPGETKDTVDAKSFTATTAWVAIPTFANTTTPWTIANDGAFPFDVRIDTGSTITTVQPKDSYTHTVALTAGQAVQVQATGGSSAGRIGIVLGDFPLARRNVMPRANAGTMWRNRLILADINTRVDSSLDWTDSGNIQRAPYALFYSEVFPDSFREQAILFASSGESQILGLHVLDDYLITIASPETETDGIRLFRGSLDYLALQAGTTTLNINVVRGGLGPKRDLTTSGNRNISCVWPEVGVVALLDLRGGVWFTDGIAVDRLDRTGPRLPDRTDTVDEVSALGKYLFVWRGGRLLILNALAGVQGEEATGAWTEVVLPEGETIKSLAPVGGSMYFVMDDQVYRFAMARNLEEDPERGAFDGDQLDLTVATPTVGSEDQHTKAVWYRFGLRTRGRSSATVGTVSVNAGPALDPSTFGHSVTLDRALVDRDEIVIPAGIGSAVEASGEAVFRGDLQLESATFWTTGMKMSRPADGSDG
jgi:hypothetical protein